MLKRELAQMIDRLKIGLTTLPRRKDAAFIAWVCLGYFGLAWLIGFGTGLYRFEPHLRVDLFRLALVAFFVPAMGEEVFFRGVMVPSRATHSSAYGRIALALLVFLLWHPLNAFLFFPSVVPLFCGWRFLTVTALLGLACTALWRRTRSLWPAIILHWLVVVVWKTFLGAPRMI
jgi:uncharacterized protein